MARARCGVACLAAVLAALAPALGAQNLEPLTKYRTAVDHLRPPNNVVFGYVMTRSGPSHVVTENHRVYRNLDGDERNETLAINGVKISPAAVTVYRRATWPYGVEQFAVGADTYDAVYQGVGLVNGRRAYAYAVKPRAPADFEITGLSIDSRRYLPLRETFSVNGAGCSGRGWIDFAPIGKYWLPSTVAVSCASSDAAATPAPMYRESIHFGDYTFPGSIPADVFHAGPAT